MLLLNLYKSKHEELVSIGALEFAPTGKDYLRTATLCYSNSNHHPSNHNDLTTIRTHLSSSHLSSGCVCACILHSLWDWVRVTKCQTEAPNPRLHAENLHRESRCQSAGCACLLCDVLRWRQLKFVPLSTGPLGESVRQASISNGHFRTRLAPGGQKSSWRCIEDTRILA